MGRLACMAGPLLCGGRCRGVCRKCLGGCLTLILERHLITTSFRFIGFVKHDLGSLASSPRRLVSIVMSPSGWQSRLADVEHLASAEWTPFSTITLLSQTLRAFPGTALISHHFISAVPDSQPKVCEWRSRAAKSENRPPPRFLGGGHIDPQGLEGCIDIRWWFWGMDGICFGRWETRLGFLSGWGLAPLTGAVIMHDIIETTLYLLCKAVVGVLYSSGDSRTQPPNYMNAFGSTRPLDREYLIQRWLIHLELQYCCSLYENAISSHWPLRDDVPLIPLRYHDVCLGHEV